MPNFYFGEEGYSSLWFCYSIEALGFNCHLRWSKFTTNGIFSRWRKGSQLHGVIPIVVCWELEV